MTWRPHADPDGAHDRANYESDEAYWADLPGYMDPERPQRTAAIAKRVERDGILTDKRSVKHVQARRATHEELLLVHSQQLLDTMGMIRDAGAVGAARRAGKQTYVEAGTGKSAAVAESRFTPKVYTGLRLRLWLRLRLGLRLGLGMGLGLGLGMGSEGLLAP